MLRAERSSSVRGAHGEALLVLIDEVLREASIPLAALTGIVVGRGPGSFTGIRVALATALGLRRACPSLPIATVTTFEALAHGHEGTFVVTVPALPGEVYAERWQDGAPLGEPTVLAEDTLTPGEKRVQATLDLRSLWRASRGKPASAELLPCYVAPPKITAPK